MPINILSQVHHNRVEPQLVNQAASNQSQSGLSDLPVHYLPETTSSFRICLRRRLGSQSGRSCCRPDARWRSGLPAPTPSGSCQAAREGWEVGMDPTRMICEHCLLVTKVQWVIKSASRKCGWVPIVNPFVLIENNCVTKEVDAGISNNCKL